MTVEGEFGKDFPSLFFERLFYIYFFGRYKMIVNKIASILLILVSLIPLIVDGDGTALIFILMIAVPMFFAKESWFYDYS